MGIFNKKKDSEVKQDMPELPALPDLPELPNTPGGSPLERTLPEENQAPELPELPSESIPNVPAGLPKIETKPITPIETKPIDTQTIPSLPTPNPHLEQRAIKQEIIPPDGNEFAPSISEPPIPQTSRRTLELPTGERSNKIVNRMSATKETEPIFIRLDKFQATLETFEEIKVKVQEIEELLKITREIKQKEEQELVEWEREVQTIKARIDMVDRTIFNKLD